MSGGSYDYAYRHVEAFADALEDGVTCPDCGPTRPTGCENNLDRLGFAAHLRKVAAAMKAIEWVDSGDCSHPHDTNAIHAVTGT
jgi:hypothetical protein